MKIEFCQFIIESYLKVLKYLCVITDLPSLTQKGSIQPRNSLLLSQRSPRLQIVSWGAADTAIYSVLVVDKPTSVVHAIGLPDFMNTYPVSRRRFPSLLNWSQSNFYRLVCCR